MLLAINSICRTQCTYSIHTGNNGEVCTGIIFHCDEYTIPLSRSDIEHLYFCRLCVNTVNLNYLHHMTFNPNIHPSKGSHVDNAEEVRLTSLDVDFQILCVSFINAASGTGSAPVGYV